jgi:hypothetical protein
VERKMKIPIFFLATCIVLAGCGSGPAPPRDENLTAFMETFAECARLSRKYSDDEDVLSDELAQVDFPENWSELVDSLAARYGGDVDFWTRTFIEISETSRR